MEDQLQNSTAVHLHTLDLQIDTVSLQDLRQKLDSIIESGKDFEFDITDSLELLLNHNNIEIKTLSVQAVAELSKCETKRNALAKTEIIKPILKILENQVEPALELVKQCCRSLGNLCCDCDKSRSVLLELKGVKTLKDVLQFTIDNDQGNLDEIKLLLCKIILNLIIGGPEMSSDVVKSGMLDLIEVILRIEVGKVEMNDDMVHTALLVLSVINEHSVEMVFSPQINGLVMFVLKETTNVEISEVCLDHLHMQVEHDSVKTLLAEDSGVHLLCDRLQIWVTRHEISSNDIDESELDVKRKALDLIVCILLGDDAIRLLFCGGKGEIYQCMLRWLHTTDYSMVTTAALAIGNFARYDSHCITMMEDCTFNVLLSLFEIYFQLHCEITVNATKYTDLDEETVIKIQQALLSAIRNLCVPQQNKKEAIKDDRTLKILLKALPEVKDFNIAYKLLGTLRMLVDGQDVVAREVLAVGAEAIGRWGRVDRPGPAAEAPRLLAWALRSHPHDLSRCREIAPLLWVEGIVSCLVKMLLSPHAVMQGEAIHSLNILASHILPNFPDENEKEQFLSQLLDADIGKHLAVVLQGPAHKMAPLKIQPFNEFIQKTLHYNNLTLCYKKANLSGLLLNLVETRNDIHGNLKDCLIGIVDYINEFDEFQ